MRSLVAVLVFVFFMISCSVASVSVDRRDKAIVAVSILPLVQFVEQIGGDKVDVAAMIPPGASPHVYEPTPGQLKMLSHAALYVKMGSGIEFEKIWMSKIADLNPDMFICNASYGVELLEMEERDKHEGEEHSHPAGGKDPHVWLSLDNAVIMAKNIRDALVHIDPGNQSSYMNNAHKYIVKLQALKERIKNNAGGIAGGKFIVFHPAWAYFARELNLTQVPVEAGGKEPSARDLVRVIEIAKRDNIKVVFASPQFNSKSAEVIAREIGGRVLLIDPLAEDYLANMENVAEALMEQTQ